MGPGRVAPGPAPAEGRTAPDWASKIHLAVAPVYYQSYLLGELLASQLDQAVREAPAASSAARPRARSWPSGCSPPAPPSPGASWSPRPPGARSGRQRSWPAWPRDSGQDHGRRGRRWTGWGCCSCVLSAAAFGSLAIFGKQAYAGGLGVVGVLALRFGLAAPLLVGLALVAGRSLRLGWPVALRLLALGGIGYAIQATLFFNALSRIPAGMAALLLYLYPALVTAGAVALGRSRLDRATAAGLALSLAGIVLVIGLPGERLDAVGVALALASACWYTCYILVGEYLLRGVDPLAASAYVSSGAACSFLAAAVGSGGVAQAAPSAYAAAAAMAVSAPPWPSPPSWPAWPGSARPGPRSPRRSSRCSPSPSAWPCSATGSVRARWSAGWPWSPGRCCCRCSAGPGRR